MSEKSLKNLSAEIATVSDLYATRYNISRDSNWYLLKLQEEMGELVKAYLSLSGGTRDERNREQLLLAFQEEVSDVFCHIVLLARNHGIDIQEAVEQKWLKYLPEKS